MYQKSNEIFVRIPAMISAIASKKKSYKNMIRGSALTSKKRSNQKIKSLHYLKVASRSTCYYSE